jgi:mannose-1-phosphate guanylyltransferase/phosphomannomutase
MTPLLGRPVMEHLLRLLKAHQITDIWVTLCYRPRDIMDYFGDGARLGVRLTYQIEEEPLGTAGSVKRCLSQMGDEDVLVLSGDCVCDLNLSSAIRFHRKKRAAATLLLYRHPEPLEYGLVVTDKEGRVERFVEKPAWGQVVTDQVNTGLYVLSPAALSRVPEGEPFDFGRDLFPALLRQGQPLYGCLLPGYWRDMGDCGAYLSCVADALSGKIKLDMGLPQVADGVWSAVPLPKDAAVTPPCWVDEGGKLGENAQIGPFAVLEKGVTVGAGARIRRSVLLERAAAGANAQLDGAILCPGGVAAEQARLCPGAVLGENALAGAQSVVQKGARLWPGQAVPKGGHLRHTLTRASQQTALRFGDGGVVQGTLGEDLDVEGLLALGSALGAEGTVGLGCSDTPAAKTLAWAAAAGASAAGGRVLTHDLSCPAQGAWAAARQEIPVSLFVEQGGGQIYLHFFDRQGLPLGRVRERKLEQTLLQGEFPRVPAETIGRMVRLPLDESRWAREVAAQARLDHRTFQRVTVAVEGKEPENRALARALAAAGCSVEGQWRAGIPSFQSRHGGFRLTARDERGNRLESGQLLALLCLIEMENGTGQVAVPPGSSAAVELVAAGFHGTVLRLDRDGSSARQLYAQQPWLRESASAAVRICSRMAVSGQTLTDLMSKTPRLSLWKREVPLTADRGRVMQTLAREAHRHPRGEGLRLRVGSGWVYLVPLSRRAALQVVAEGSDLELAAELCDFYASRVAQTDKSLSKQSVQELPEK